MFFNDIFATIAIIFLISFVSVMVLFASTILFIIFYKKNRNKKLIYGYLGILLLSVFGIYLSFPWLFLNIALFEPDNKQAVKYYDMALNTAIFPKVRATMYEFKASHYYTVDKNITLAIDNCEKFNKLKGDLPEDCQLWSMYLINEDYDKAIEQLKNGNLPEILSMAYLLKGETQTAIDIISEKIMISPQAWDYAYRANFYNYAGKPELAKKDYDMAIKMKPKLEKNKRFEEMYSNKNYFFEQLKKNRKEYNLD